MIMVRRLVAGELDVAICVTEGLVAGVAQNPELCLFGTYVESPLPWAISVGVGAKYSSIDDLAFGATFGISRAGSGSEVMAKYACSLYEWKGAPKFKVLGDVNGLIGGVQEGQADAFLWERTTMQRHYDRNEVRYLGTVRPPWPAFSFGATREFVQGSARVQGFLEGVRVAIGRFMDLDASEREAFVVDTLGYSTSDVQQWLGYVRFSGDCAVDPKRTQAVVAALQRAGVIDQIDAADIVAPLPI
ncbi:hypothetical protein GGF46_001998 [Coemansia sp. RSA 552]|nr:hypothetical protein GGF46_001998 [Coemansia sp. RSA 552]